MSGDFCVKCDNELSVYCGPCMDVVRSQQDALQAEVERLNKGLRDIRDQLYEAECDCPPEWPRCSYCKTRLRIQVLLRKDEP